MKKEETELLNVFSVELFFHKKNDHENKDLFKSNLECLMFYLDTDL